jgi:hypothetical protein
MFLKPGTLSLICVSIYYKRIKPQGAEYDEGFLFRLYVNLYVAPLLALKLIWSNIGIRSFRFFVQSSLVVYFSRKISNHVDSSSEFN